jgi:hypothetical protein
MTGVGGYCQALDPTPFFLGSSGKSGEGNDRARIIPSDDLMAGWRDEPCPGSPDIPDDPNFRGIGTKKKRTRQEYYHESCGICAGNPWAFQPPPLTPEIHRRIRMPSNFHLDRPVVANDSQLSSTICYSRGDNMIANASRSRLSGTDDPTLPFEPTVNLQARRAASRNVGSGISPAVFRECSIKLGVPASGEFAASIERACRVNGRAGSIHRRAGFTIADDTTAAAVRARPAWCRRSDQPNWNTRP